MIGVKLGDELDRKALLDESVVLGVVKVAELRVFEPNTKSELEGNWTKRTHWSFLFWSASTKALIWFADSGLPCMRAISRMNSGATDKAIGA